MTRERRFQIILAGGDLVALLLFVFIGQADHQTLSAENPVGGALAAGAPFVLVWAVSAYLLGAFRADAANPRVLFTRALNAWLVALPIGIVLRAVLLERAVVPLAFVFAAYGFGGLIVLGWRMAFVTLYARVSRPKPGQ